MYQLLKGTQYTFRTGFGVSKTGKTVNVSILDQDGNVLVSGFTASSVIELGSGNYGVKITFSSNFSGYIKWNNVTDSIILFDAISIIEDFRTDITAIKKMEVNRWKITGNQFILYDDDGTTVLRTFNLYKEGVLNGETPDERRPV